MSNSLPEKSRSPTPTRGRFITFEGPEGSGKTTHAKALAERLKSAGFDVMYTREPGGTLLGESIRGLLQHDTAGEAPCAEAELLLFAASRAQLVRNVIRPALERGVMVVCDRFVDSTTAYQGYGRGFNVQLILAVNNVAMAGTEPDLTILLDVDIDAGFERVHGRQGVLKGLDRIEREERVFHERVRDGYLELADRYPHRIKRINARRSVEEVNKDVWSLVNKVMGDPATSMAIDEE